MLILDRFTRLVGLLLNMRTELVWLLVTSFFIYLLCKSIKTTSWGEIATIVIVSGMVIFLQTMLSQVYYVGSMFDDNLCFYMAYILIAESIICTFYKFKNISRIRIILGVITGLILGVVMYYHGNVRGEISYIISDGGGMHIKAPYNMYRWSVYGMEVLYPWFFIFNIFISPYWKRDIKVKTT